MYASVMVDLRVTVVPVVLAPLADDAHSAQMGASMLRPAGEWLSSTVSDPSTALETSRRMLHDALHPEVRVTRGLENAGVDYASGSPNLLLTAVLPIAAAELDNTADNWPLLTPWVGDVPAERVRLLRLDPVQAAMIAYWRGQLVRTTAAFDFLPKYFTMFHARSVYSSVWGERQPDGNFQRWLLSAEGVETGKVCQEVEDDEARRETQTMFAQELAATAPGVSAAMVEQQWEPKIIGTSAGVAGLTGIAALLPAAQVVGALVGATIGYQRARSVGRPPRWYCRTSRNRTLLKTWYPVRPPATDSPPTVVA